MNPYIFAIMELNFKMLGEGPPLIILHGLFGSLDNWMGLAKEFAKKHTVYLVDQRNHGFSPHAEAFDYTTMAQDLNDFITVHSIENPVLLGHSMGGKTVMRYGFLHPKSWHKLIIVDIAPREYPVHHQQIIDGLKSLPVGSLTSRSQADQHLAKYIEDAGQRQFLLKNLQRQSEGGFRWKMNLPVIEREISTVGEGFSDQIPLPGNVLFIRGAKSHYIQPEDEDEIVRLFPNAEIVSIEGGGHWVHAEKPRELIAAVENFIDG